DDLVERVNQRGGQVELLIERQRRPLTAVVAGDGVDGDPIEPAAEGAALILVALDVPERIEEDLGGQVLRQPVVMDPRPDEAVDLRGVTVIELAEGAGIGLRALDRIAPEGVGDAGGTRGSHSPPRYRPSGALSSRKVLKVKGGLAGPSYA